ncbi:MAG TPA: nitronate monooxygenase [Fimbriimonas sp.]
MAEPKIIQGGMGVAVSNWRLARAVSTLGQMGVISGTAIDVVLARRLQLGDEGGHMRRALDAFPDPEMAARVWNRYFVPFGKASGKPFKSKPLPNITPSQDLLELIVVANFAEVWLAKEGHDGVVGINLLEKIQAPTLPSLFGAMLAGVDYVLMGAGIPRQVPAVLDRFAEWQPAEYRVDVHGGEITARLDPAEVLATPMRLKRPKFLPIITSATLAQTLARKSTGRVDGFIVEGKTAGGHNAPPRGPLQLDEQGEPIYGPRDVPDLAAIREIGLPFWLAGSYADPDKLREALDTGAAGIQVGTAFAFCEESGIAPELKDRVLKASAARQLNVFTDPLASPTGFPFKVGQVEGTLSERPIYESRPRLCDLGYLRQPYQKEDGTIGYRCAAEPVEDYLAKGGKIEDTVGRKCVCNGLMATIGLGQTRKDGYKEAALVTAGDEVATVARFLKPGQASYSAKDVVERLLQGAASRVTVA